MKRKLATTLVVTAALVLSMLATFSGARPAAAQATYDDPDTPLTIFPIDGVPTSFNDNLVVKWNDELLQTVRANPRITGPTVTSRALGVVHTAMYDAWAAYDGLADGVHYQQKRDTQRTAENKNKAISFAAYETLKWMFPARAAVDVDPSPDVVLGEYAAQLKELTYAVDDPSLPAQVGREAAQATIAYRSNDNSNQDAGYTVPPDYYTPKNTWDKINVPWKWQPLCVLTAAGVQAGRPHIPPPGEDCAKNPNNPEQPNPHYVVQTALHPHWGNVKSFALEPAHVGQYNPPGPPADGTKDVTTALSDTSNLDDTKKVTAEYWADGPNSEFPPGHWSLFAQAFSRKRLHSVDTDVKMFFVMGNAVLDAGISSWKAKFTHDYWRPTSAIRHLNAGKQINTWLGPGNGYGLRDGSQWRPYQSPTVLTPAFPEYTSGHSTFSAAARITLTAFTGSDTFNGQVTIKAGKSLIEPGKTPARDVVLKWRSFLDAADQAGMSRRYGGIHFESGDRQGRANGATIGYWVYDKAKSYWEGRAIP